MNDWAVNYASFNVFVDYKPETGDMMWINRGGRHWLLVKVPQNRKVTTNVRRDNQLSTIISIELINFGFGKLHQQL